MAPVDCRVNHVNRIKPPNRAALVLGIFVMGVLACVWAGVPVAAFATAGDRGATAAYVRAEGSFVRLQAAEIGAIVTAIDEEAAKIQKDCPSVLVDAPGGKQLEEFGEEVGAAVLFSGAVPNRSAMLAFARRISVLQWSDRKIKRAVRLLVSEERAIANLVIPNVCTDLGAWVASGHRRLSQSTVEFLRQARAIGKGVGTKEESFSEVVSRLLARHESPSERRAAKYAERLEKTTGKTALHAYRMAMEAVQRTLGLK
jgi:hypothetical protein